MQMRDNSGIRIGKITQFVKNITQYYGTNKDKDIQDNPWDKDILIHRGV